MLEIRIDNCNTCDIETINYPIIINTFGSIEEI